MEFCPATPILLVPSQMSEVGKGFYYLPLTLDTSTDGLHLDQYIRVSCVKGQGGTVELVSRWSASVSNDRLICVWTHDWVDHWEIVEMATGWDF